MTSDLSSSSPTNFHNDLICSASAKRFLSPQVSLLSDYIPPTTDPSNFSIQQFIQKLSSSFSSTTINQYSELTALLCIYVMIIRTYTYVQQRRSGLVGPAMAIPLLKFWAIFGLTEWFFYIISLYLSSFQGQWLVSLSRATIFLLLSSGQQLSITERIYDRYLVPFYDEHSNEIDQFLTRCKTNWGKVNEELRDLAKLLLMRIAVDGLSGAIPLPSAQDFDREKTERVKEKKLKQQPTDVSHLADDTEITTTERRFFAGAGNDRAQAVRQSITSKNLNGLVQVAKAQPPKAPFEDARRLREEFRNRLRRKQSQKTIPD